MTEFMVRGPDVCCSCNKVKRYLAEMQLGADDGGVFIAYLCSPCLKGARKSILHEKKNE